MATAHPLPASAGAPRPAGATHPAGAPRPGAATAERAAAGEAGQAKPRDVKWGDPEPLIDGIVDLGALATEFLILGLEPYPRKPDAVFEPPQDAAPEPGPFAALAKLAKN